MTKKLIAIRVSQATKQKLDSLIQIHGTQTEAVAVAIDRLHQQEVDTMSYPTKLAAQHMSRAARAAAYAAGLSSVHHFQIISHARIVDESQLEELGDTLVIRAYSKTEQKSADITAGDLFFYLSEYDDAPIARLAA